MQVEFISRLKDFVILPYIKGGKWDGENWILLTDLVFRYNGKEYTVPAGRVTNFGSIPHLFRVTLNPMGKSLRPFVVHDETYSIDGVLQVKRREGDEILYQLSLQEGESKYSARKINYGLFLGGWSHFKKENTVSCGISKSVIDYIIECNKEMYNETDRTVIDRGSLRNA